jgi:hypothetical protein
MKALIVNFSLLYFFIFQSSCSGDTSSFRFFPLNIGDRYVYYIEKFLSQPPTYTRYYVTSVVTRDSILSGKRYIFSEGIPSFNNLWIRVDSIGNVYAYDSSTLCPFYFFENRIDSLSAIPNDTIKDCIESISKYVCVTYDNHTIFGISTSRKEFYRIQFFAGGATTLRKQFSKNFGLTCLRTSLTSGIYQITTTCYLRGCVINNVVFGDTNLVSINQSSAENATGFRLYQNYPNPFNPSTNIRFDLPEDNFVTIKIYDILGKEVKTIVNEFKHAGSYRVSFIASSVESRVPSGVYYYVMRSGRFLDKRRMVILK